MVVFDDLALLGTVVFSDNASATKGEPLNEVVERLTLVGRGLDGGPQLRISDVLKEEARPDSYA